MTQSRLATLSDHPDLLPTVAAWHQQAFGYLDASSTTAGRVARLQRHLGPDAIPTTFLIFADGQPAGCASLVASDMSVRPDLTPWLASVFVVPEFRRRGLGAALVRQVVAAATVTPHETLYLYTVDQEALYARLGWQVQERLPYRGYQVALMSIAVTGALHR